MRVSRTLDGVLFSGLVNGGDEVCSVTLDGDPVDLSRLPADLAYRVELALLTAAREAADGADYDGPSDDELSAYYGGGGVRPIEEQYREAANFKRTLK